MAFELEVVSRKVDRFGWDSMEAMMQQRLISDWVDRLADYMVEEVRAAIKAIMAENPKLATNEEAVGKVIDRDRAKRAASLPRVEVDERTRVAPTQEQRDRMQALLEQAGFAPKKFGG